MTDTTQQHNANDFKVSSYPHGLFSWVDASSTDQAKAKDFYVAVLGWEAQDMPIDDTQHYTMFFAHGASVAGLGQMSEEMKAGGVPSHWNNYIAVDDVDALMPKVTELNGKIIAPPFDVMSSGRMAVIQDPSGGMVALWQAKNHKGAGLVNYYGAVCWNELNTRDAEAAKAFYAGLLGWTYQDGPMPNYHLIMNNGRMNGGIMEMDDSFGEMPPSWSAYISVQDLVATVEKVKANGGTVAVGPMESSAGQFAVIADPTGAHISLIQPTEMDKSWEAEG